MIEHVDYAVLAKRALERLSPEDRQLVEWHFGRSRWGGFGRGGWDLAVGYLLERALGREVSPKIVRECRETLEEMRITRAREISRAAA